MRRNDEAKGEDGKSRSKGEREREKQMKRRSYTKLEEHGAAKR